MQHRQFVGGSAGVVLPPDAYYRLTFEDALGRNWSADLGLPPFSLRFEHGRLAMSATAPIRAITATTTEEGETSSELMLYLFRQVRLPRFGEGGDDKGRVKFAEEPKARAVMTCGSIHVDIQCWDSHTTAWCRGLGDPLRLEDALLQALQFVAACHLRTAIASDRRGGIASTTIRSVGLKGAKTMGFHQSSLSGPDSDVLTWRLFAKHFEFALQQSPPATAIAAILDGVAGRDGCDG